jgi:glycosyltransferase involved in cell wall biosynthesis
MDASRDPLVSICIPTHDDAPVVADALRSAMRQDYSPLEILVVDNHSSDATWKSVKALAANDGRVRIMRNPENVGMARNFNLCIEAAAGEFALILCADDALADGCVVHLAGALREHPEAVLAACGRKFTDPDLRPVGVSRSRSHRTVVDSADMLRECFVHGNRIGEPSAVMFRKQAALRGFDPEYSQAIDLEMWFHLLDQGAAVLLPEPLSFIRQHGNQTTKANIRSGRIVRDKQLLFRRYSARVANSLSLTEKLEWDARMASSLVRARAEGCQTDSAAMSELFYPAIFLRLLCPLIGLGWRFRAMLGRQRL